MADRPSFTVVFVDGPLRGETRTFADDVRFYEVALPPSYVWEPGTEPANPLYAEPETIHYTIMRLSMFGATMRIGTHSPSTSPEMVQDIMDVLFTKEAMEAIEWPTPKSQSD